MAFDPSMMFLQGQAPQSGPNPLMTALMRNMGVQGGMRNPNPLANYKLMASDPRYVDAAWNYFQSLPDDQSKANFLNTNENRQMVSAFTLQKGLGGEELNRLFGMGNFNPFTNFTPTPWNPDPSLGLSPPVHPDRVHFGQGRHMGQQQQAPGYNTAPNYNPMQGFVDHSSGISPIELPGQYPGLPGSGSYDTNQRPVMPSGTSGDVSTGFGWGPTIPMYNNNPISGNQSSPSGVMTPASQTLPGQQSVQGGTDIARTLSGNIANNVGTSRWGH